MVKKVLVTGIAGFIGHHICEHLLKNTDWEIIGLDKLNYASDGFNKLKDINAMPNDRVKVFAVDLTKPISVGVAQEIGEVDYIIHLAAESHVDRSITDPVPFVQNNINSTLYFLEYARTLKGLKRFIYFSTDEVFGTAPEGINYKEGDRFNCGNPYSASKGGAECLCQAYANTYKLPIVITNTMNVIGERQHSEKYVPKIIQCVRDGERLTIHSSADKKTTGKRHYIHARNVADALVFILTETTETLDNIYSSIGRFNIVGEVEYDNLELANSIAEILEKPLKYELVDFHSSRPGHDLRYALDGTKMEELGWKHPKTFTESLIKTVMWSLKNDKWLKEKEEDN